jgi:hypothetical protein
MKHYAARQPFSLWQLPKRIWLALRIIVTVILGVWVVALNLMLPFGIFICLRLAYEGETYGPEEYNPLLVRQVLPSSGVFRGGGYRALTERASRMRKKQRHKRQSEPFSRASFSACHRAVC